MVVSRVDAWHLPSFAHHEDSLDFYWGYKRQNARLLERLDKFYVGQWVASFGGLVSIWPCTVLSDHALVSIHLRS